MAKHSRAIYFFAVLIVVVSNVVFAPDWQSGPLSPMPKFKVGTYESPATAANTDDPNAVLSSNTVVTPNTKDNTNTPVAQTPSQPSAIDNISTQVEQTSSQPKCDISACRNAYRSFQESDCTYQPSNGPRRLCTKGAVASEPNGEPNVRCNVNACAAAYRSFNPSDCTYQPSDGPRRLCAK
jgi:BA14K-like protein